MRWLLCVVSTSKDDGRPNNFERHWSDITPGHTVHSSQVSYSSWWLVDCCRLGIPRWLWYITLYGSFSAPRVRNIESRFRKIEKRMGLDHRMGLARRMVKVNGLMVFTLSYLNKKLHIPCRALHISYWIRSWLNPIVIIYVIEMNKLARWNSRWRPSHRSVR